MSVMSGRTIAIGDVHGCAHTLLDLLQVINPVKGDTVIFLGDYIDRGPHSKTVVNIIMRLQADSEGSASFIPLKGNHEDMCVDYFRPGNGMCGTAFMSNGGAQTIESFGGVISDEYLDWMSSLPVMLENEHGYFCHAGFEPDILPQDQREYTMLWIREEFLHSGSVWNKPVIHGHTPHPEVVLSRRRIGLDTGCVFGERYSGMYGKLSAYDFTNRITHQVTKSKLDD